MTSNEVTRSRTMYRVARWLLDHPVPVRFIAVLWVLGVIAAAGFFAPFALKFVQKTKATFHPPKGSVAQRAGYFLNNYFLQSNYMAVEFDLAFVILTSSDGAPLFSLDLCPPGSYSGNPFAEAQARRAAPAASNTTPNRWNAAAPNSTVTPNGTNADNTTTPYPWNTAAPNSTVAPNGTNASNTTSSPTWAPWPTTAPAPTSTDCSCAQDFFQQVSQYFWSSGVQINNIQGYFTPQMILPELGPLAYMSPDHSAMLITVDAMSNSPTEFRSLIEGLYPAVETESGAVFTCPNGRSFTFAATSVQQAVGDMESAVLSGLERIDVVSIPVALLLLAVAARSLRMLLVPLLALPVCVLSVFAGLRPYGETHNIPPMAPEVVAAIMVALTIDFSLFTVTRFREAAELSDESIRDFWVTALVVPSCLDVEETGHDGASASGLAEVPPRLRQLAVVIIAAKSSFRNISFSGFTISIVFACLTITPNSMIHLLAFTSAMGAIGATLTATLFTPPLMLVAYHVLWTPVCGGGDGRCCSCGKASCRDGEEQRSDSPSLVSLTLQEPLLESDFALEGRPTEAAEVIDPEKWPQAMRRKWQRLDSWGWIAAFAIRRRYAVIAGLTCLLAPFAWAIIAKGEIGFSVYSEVPIDAQSTKLLQYLGSGREFSTATNNPFYLVFNLPLPQNPPLPSDPTYYEPDPLLLVVDFAARAAESQLTSDCHVTFRAFSPTRRPSRGTAVLNRQFGAFLTAVDSNYSQLVQMTLSPTQIQFAAAAVVPIVVMGADPWGTIGSCVYRTLDRVREQALASAAFRESMPMAATLQTGNDGGWPPPFDTDAAGRVALESVFVGFAGPNDASYAISSRVYEAFWPLVGATVGVMTASAFLFFRSIFVSIRLVFTIAWTAVFATGTTVLAFSVARVCGDAGSQLQWLVPLLGFTLITAVTLDYDGFVLSRVVEERLKPGVDDSAAVVAAVRRTGMVVSYAGCIMAVAFGSLVLSDMVLLRQFAVMITSAVLADAFVVRPVLVPALMTVLPHAVWWPRRMPNPESNTTLLEDV